MWEKEKLLVTSNFSFSHIVFKRLVLQTRKNQGLFGKGLRSSVDNYTTPITTPTPPPPNTPPPKKKKKKKQVKGYTGVSVSVSPSVCVLVYFQYVNERTAHVKIDRVSRGCRPGP